MLQLALNLNFPCCLLFGDRSCLPFPDRGLKEPVSQGHENSFLIFVILIARTPPLIGVSTRFSYFLFGALIGQHRRNESVLKPSSSLTGIKVEFTKKTSVLPWPTSLYIAIRMDILKYSTSFEKWVSSVIMGSPWDAGYLAQLVNHALLLVEKQLACLWAQFGGDGLVSRNGFSCCTSCCKLSDIQYWHFVVVQHFSIRTWFRPGD